jgi:hypothetical protein
MHLSLALKVVSMIAAAPWMTESLYVAGTDVRSGESNIEVHFNRAILVNGVNGTIAYDLERVVSGPAALMATCTRDGVTTVVMHSRHEVSVCSHVLDTRLYVSLEVSGLRGGIAGGIEPPRKYNPRPASIR